jgi:putative endonuclease
MNENFFGVYIMGNENKTLYVGMSNNIIRRVIEHKKGKKDGFTKKYNLKKCVYYKFIETGNRREVVIREKQRISLEKRN